MKTTTLWCEAGKHHWERPSQRGRRPVNCPEHGAGPVLVKKIEVRPKKTEQTGDPLAKARAAKEAKRESERIEAIERRRQELERLRKSLPRLGSEYDAALTAASNSKGFDKKLWDRCDMLQGRIIGTQTAVTRIEKELV
jgi:hypothetical protein